MTSVPVLASVHALLVAGALVRSASTAFAETTPRSGPHDNRVRIATWEQGQVYLAIRPVIHVDQGTRITVMVDRDLEIF